MIYFCKNLFFFLFVVLLAIPALADEVLPPSEINKRDRPQAAQLIQQWFDLNRDDPKSERNMETEYISAISFYRVSSDVGPAVQFLAEELKSAKNPKTIYIINGNLAGIKIEEKEFDEAIVYWNAARESMLNNTHPYFTTRQALPLQKIARIYHLKKQDDKAIEFYERYRQSEYGKKYDNGIVSELGDIYKSRGDWGKAKELYQYYSDVYKKQQWANEEFKQGTLKAFQKRLAGLPDEQENVKILAQRLKSEEWFERRKAFHELMAIFKDKEKKESWILWMDRFLKENPDPRIQEAFMTLRQYLSPPTVLGSHDEEAEQILKNAAVDEKKYKPYRDLLEIITEDKFILTFLEKLSWWGQEPDFTLGQLCLNKEYHEHLSERYVELRNSILQAQSREELPKSAGERILSIETLQEIQDILKESSSFSDLLKRIVSFQNQYSGPAVLLLYSLGNIDDIPFIIENIPLSVYQRNFMFWSLVSNLYRYGTMDIPHILEVDKEPYLDWWNVKTSGTSPKEKFQAWWKKEKDHFSYTQVNRPGKLLRTATVLMGITRAVSAPEINGIFWLEEGGRDYSAMIYYFNFATEQTTEILSGGYDGGGSYQSTVGWNYSTGKNQRNIGPIGGMHWNALDYTLEFTIESVGTFGAVFEGTKLSKIVPLNKSLTVDKTVFKETIQSFAEKTFEVRGGDLYLVNEKTGTEKMLLEYGYVLSFLLSPTLEKVVIIDRDILGQSLWLIDLNDFLK